MLIKHLYLHDDKPRLDRYGAAFETDEFTLGSESTMVVEMTFARPLSMDKASIERKYYADRTVQRIEKDKPLLFEIDAPGSSDAADVSVLRIGLGREHGKSLQPQVMVNGSAIPVQENFHGQSQKDRETFFGVLELPLPAGLVMPKNTVSISFPDGGGHISSVALKTLMPARISE